MCLYCVCVQWCGYALRVDYDRLGLVVVGLLFGVFIVEVFCGVVVSGGVSVACVFGHGFDLCGCFNGVVTCLFSLFLVNGGLRLCCCVCIVLQCVFLVWFLVHKLVLVVCGVVLVAVFVWVSFLCLCGWCNPFDCGCFSFGLRVLVTVFSCVSCVNDGVFW